MDALVIMAKAPEPNKVKTRLTPNLDPIVASDIYTNFLLDKIEQAQLQKGVHLFLAYSPVSSKKFFEQFLAKKFSLIEQTEGDLGLKIVNILKALFNQNFRKVILIDSDTPNLPSEYIFAAFHHLDDSDVVIGPSEDGGFYLIGIKSYKPEIFSNIPWSTSTVTEVTVNNALHQGLSVYMLDKWYDIDNFEDLKRLKNDLNLNPQIGYHCKYTLMALSKINL